MDCRKYFRSSETGMFLFFILEQGVFPGMFSWGSDSYAKLFSWDLFKQANPCVSFELASSIYVALILPSLYKTCSYVEFHAYIVIDSGGVKRGKDLTFTMHILRWKVSMTTWTPATRPSTSDSWLWKARRAPSLLRISAHHLIDLSVSLRDSSLDCLRLFYFNQRCLTSLGSNGAVSLTDNKQNNVAKQFWLHIKKKLLL